jgi:hypothetical protein
MRLRRLASIFALAAWLCLAQGCDTASRTAAGWGSTSQPVPAVPQDMSPPGLPHLPLPWTLLEGRLLIKQFDPGVRRAAYANSDLIQNASDYVDSFPHQNARRQGVWAVLSPDWVDNSHSSAAGLAYCTYQFHVPGFDGWPRVRAHWQAAPLTAGTCWFGLANWVRNRWDWYPDSEFGFADTPSFDPYLTTSGDLLLVVLRIGTDASIHWQVRLGAIPPIASLTVRPSAGSVPFTADLDATDSIAMEGSFAKFEWDTDGDGIFEADTADSPHYTFTYNIPGVYHAAVRLTNSCNATDTSPAFNVSVTGSWQHTWGLSGADTATGIIVDQFKHVIFSVGTMESPQQPGTRDILVCRWTSTGQLLWAKKFDSGGDDCAFDACGGADSSLVIVGSFQNGGNLDTLVQRWTMDGQLEWSVNLGGAGPEEARKVFMLSTDQFIVAGDTGSSSATPDVFVCSMEINDGSLDWVQTQDLGAAEHVTSLTCGASVAVGVETELAGVPSIALLEFSGGTLTACHRLGDSLSSLRGGQVFIGSDDADIPYYVVSGAIDEGTGYQPFVVHLDQTGACTWGKVLATPASARIEGMVVDTLSAGGVTLIGAMPGSDALDRVLLLNFSPLDGGLIGGRSWGGTGAGADCQAVIRMYGTGLVLAGSSVDATGSWEPLTGAVTGLALGFTDITATGGAADWPVVSDSEAITDVTAQGVLDTGGGAIDSLIMFALAPQP